jgi:hypothetical protein
MTRVRSGCRRCRPCWRRWASARPAPPPAASVPSNRPMTQAARKAVSRLMPSQTARRRLLASTGANMSVSSSRPAMPIIECSACSRMTSTTSSMVMRPSRWPRASTTGAEIRSWPSKRLATSWLGIGGMARSRSPSASATGVSGSAVSTGAPQDALVVVLAVDDEQLVGVRRQVFEQAQVAQHHVQRDLRAHRDRVQCSSGRRRCPRDRTAQVPDDLALGAGKDSSRWAISAGARLRSSPDASRTRRTPGCPAGAAGVT